MAEREWRPAAPNASTRKPAGAVDHRGLFLESRRRGHEPEQRQDAVDAIEGSELGPQHRQRVQRAPARRLRPLDRGQMLTENTGMHELAVVIARELSGCPGPPGVDHHRVEGIVRRERTGQDDPQRVEPRVDGRNAGRDGYTSHGALGSLTGPRCLPRNRSTSVPCQRCPP